MMILDSIEKDKVKEQLKNIVAFCILMQNDAGILTKAPNYIIEKFERYCSQGMAADAYQFGLDAENNQILNKWLSLWEDQIK